MVPFDPRAYEDEVVKPLRRRLPHLPADLLTRYAIDLDMDAGQLRERTAAVLRLWARIAQRAGQSGLVCAQFLREHDELTRIPAADLTDPRWWQRRERVRNRQLEPEIADLAALSCGPPRPRTARSATPTWTGPGRPPRCGSCRRSACPPRPGCAAGSTA